MPTLNSQQLACLASPIRNQTFMTLRRMGTASARELAEEMGRTPASTHYHVKELLAAGLIREQGRRPTARKPEAIYEPVEKTYQLPNLREQPELASITRRAVTAGLRSTIRGYEAAAAKAQEDQSLREYMHVIRAAVRLSPDDAQAFMAMIESASKFAREHDTRDGVRLHWSSLVFPDVKIQ